MHNIIRYMYTFKNRSRSTYKIFIIFISTSKLCVCVYSLCIKHKTVQHVIFINAAPAIGVHIINLCIER